MRRVPESEVENEFERQYAWGDDERNYYHPLKKKAGVFGCHLRLNTVVEAVRKHVRPGGRIADMASAQGNYALTLAEAGFEVTAVDLKPEFLKYAEKKHTHGSFRTVQANVMDYTDPVGFDAVLLGEIIEHVAHPKNLLQSASRNLKVGGVVVLTTPNGGQFGQKLPTFSQVTDFSAFESKQFHWGDHLFLYTREELALLLNESGFDVVQVFGIHSDYVSQLKGVRYLLPYRFLKWMELKTRGWKINGQDSTNTLIAIGKKRG